MKKLIFIFILFIFVPNTIFSEAPIQGIENSDIEKKKETTLDRVINAIKNFWEEASVPILISVTYMTIIILMIGSAR